MSLKKRKSSNKKKRGSQSSGPVVPRGYKYLGKHGNKHYVLSPTDTVYSGSGTSESGYDVVDDVSLWKRPKGFEPAGGGKKSRPKASRKKKPMTEAESAAFYAERRKEIKKKEQEKQLESLRKAETKKQRKAVEAIVKKIQKAESFAEIHNIDSEVNKMRGLNKSEAKLINDTIARQFKALKAQERAVRRKEEKSAKASKAQLDARARKKKMAEDEKVQRKKKLSRIKDQISNADSNEDIDNLVKLIREDSRQKAWPQIRASDVKEVERFAKKVKKIRDERAKPEDFEKAVKSAAKAVEETKKKSLDEMIEDSTSGEGPSEIWRDKAGKEYSWVASAKTKAEADRQIAFHKRKWSKAKFHVEQHGDRRLIYMHRPEYKTKTTTDYLRESDSVSDLSQALYHASQLYAKGEMTEEEYKKRRAIIYKRSKELGMDKTSADIMWTVDMKAKIRRADSHDEIDSLVKLAKSRKPSLSKGLIKDLEMTAIDRGRDIPLTKSMSSDKKKTKEARGKDTGIETMLGFAREFLSKDDYEVVKDAKTLGEFNDALAKYHDRQYYEEEDVLRDSASLLDASKAIAVAPRHSTQFRLSDKRWEGYQQVHGLSYDTLPVLPKFIEDEYRSQIVVIDESGKRISSYATNYMDPLMKATKGQDILWFSKKDRPLIGVNQKTGERIVLAPRVPYRGLDREKALLAIFEEHMREGLIPTHKGRVQANHKVVFTRTNQFIELPDGRALKLSKNTASSVDDFSDAQDKASWSVPTLDKLTKKEMYQYAFLTSFNETRGIGDMERGIDEARWVKGEPADSRFNNERTAEIKTAELSKHKKESVSLKEHTRERYGKKEKVYKASKNGEAVYFRRKLIDNARAVLGNDVKFHWDTKKESRVLVANSKDGLAQIRIAGGS